MPREFSRTLRVAEQIQRELAELIRLEVKDPRVGMVTLTDVEVAADYGHAKVYFTVMGDNEQAETAAAGLNRAAGFLRYELGQRIKLHSVPQLHFEYDESVERGMRVSRLIDEAVGTSTTPAKKRRRAPSRKS